MYTKFIIAIALISLSCSFEPGHEKESYIFNKFQQFLKEHNKKYSTIEEYMARFKIFKNNYLKIENFSISADSKATHQVGVTKFMDMTPQEFRKTYLNLNVKLLNTIMFNTNDSLEFKEDTAPEALDWRQSGAVGPVKDQGSCGSCWAFSTVGNLEGLNYIKNKQFVQFSEQQLVDCDKVDEGCNGGLMENAFDYIKNAGGLEAQKDYPYKGRGAKCAFAPAKAAIKVSGFVLKNDMDEAAMKEFLATTGPLAIAINADPLQFYDGGIIDEDSSSCDPDGLNHGVTLIGYGSENGNDYWILKNSWGSGWGENGYFRFARGKGTCGVNKYVSSAVLA